MLLFTDKKIAVRILNENIHWWPDDKIILRFIEDNDYYWFILYQQGKNLLSKENIGFFKKNPITQNYLRFKKNYEQKAILRFALYKNVEMKIADNDKDEEDGENNETEKEKEKSKNINYELNIIKRMKTIYDVKFLKINEIEDNSVEYSLIKNIEAQHA